MYLSIIILPLLGSIVSGFFGRKVGVTGSRILGCLSIITTTILAIISFFEVGFNNNPISINLFKWLDSESFNMVWNFQFDSLTVSMLIPVLVISSLVHFYSIGYMSHDPHSQRFFSYLSLFTFMMIILVTGNNYLLMFVGWEGVGVCSYLLVSFWFTRIAANQSSLSAFLTNRVGDCFLTIGMFVILWSLGRRKNCKVFINKKISKLTPQSNTLINTQRCLHKTTNILGVQACTFYFNHISRTQIRNYSNSSFAPYLAGLIEGDGHIAVHDKNTQKKEYRPKIIIAFNINDKPLAEKLSTELNVGKVIDRSSAGHVLLQILAKEEVLKIINLINGHMRTPKIEALHRAICWINEKDNSSIPLLCIDSSSLDSNSWLAGFTDADGCFGITIYDRKKNGVFLRTSVQTSFRIEVKQNYSREVTLEQGGSSFFNIMSEIAGFFSVNLYTRTRKTEDKVFHAFAAVAHNSRSHVILRNYFDNYPLYSSKYLAYKDWCLVQDLHRGSLSKDNLERIKAIKNEFNTKKKVFDFSHLNSLQLK
jgi:hypothetical protein